MSETNDNGGSPQKKRRSDEEIVADVMARLEKEPAWKPLYDEALTAERLRKSGTVGWRRVWNDIIRRWAADTGKGAKAVAVTTPPSGETLGIIESYRHAASSEKRPAPAPLPAPGNGSRRAFAVCAVGERFQKFKNNLIEELKVFVPAADIAELDIDKARGFLSGVPERHLPMFARLAIPMMPEFRQYDRVIWVDADVDIQSDAFASILDVETGDDGLAAAADMDQESRKAYIKERFPEYDHAIYFNSGVLVMDMAKIDVDRWRKSIAKGIEEHARRELVYWDQDVLNWLFEMKEIDPRFNWMYANGRNPDAWAIHYAAPDAKGALDRELEKRAAQKSCARPAWKRRCIVVSPRHEFIRPWIRAYFGSGNTIPLVLVPGPGDDWRDGDQEYCRAAVEFCGGMVLDCSQEWKTAIEGPADRAAKRWQIGWYSKKYLLKAVAERLAPESWAWIDDDAEVTGDLTECFDFAEKAPGFICSQFYYPCEDNMHPDRLYRWKLSTGEKLCWNSLVFFHGEANRRISQQLGKDFPVEDDEIIFGHLYRNDRAWHDGFYDFSKLGWQKMCARMHEIPDKWTGKLLHYTSAHDKRATKRMWTEKVDKLPLAPFEDKNGLVDMPVIPTAITAPGSAVAAKAARAPEIPDDQAIDAVFVIGKGSQNNNEELRYALRDLDRYCKFVRNVYICGECPEWVDKSVVKHLQWPDSFGPKDSNIIDKLRHACEAKGMAKRILFCSDDQFVTRECDWEDFSPRWLRQYKSDDKWYEDQKRVWHSRLRKTLEREVQRRKDAGMDTESVFYYEPHMWMQIDRDKFIEYAKWSDYQHRDDTIIASGYFNFADAGGRAKFDHSFPGGEFKQLPSTTHIAYHDTTYKSVMPILRNMFPNRCRFEVGGAAPVPRAVNVAQAAPAAQAGPRSSASDRIRKAFRTRLERMLKARGDGQ